MTTARTPPPCLSEITTTAFKIVTCVLLTPVSRLLHGHGLRIFCKTVCFLSPVLIHPRLQDVPEACRFVPQLFPASHPSTHTCREQTSRLADFKHYNTFSCVGSRWPDKYRKRHCINDKAYIHFLFGCVRMSQCKIKHVLGQLFL